MLARAGRVALEPLARASVITMLALAGCSFGEPKVKIVNPPAPGIAYRFGNSIAEVKGKAQRYCGQWHKEARLDTVKPAGTERIARFDCV
jgi:hypothetical protein